MKNLLKIASLKLNVRIIPTYLALSKPRVAFLLIFSGIMSGLTAVRGGFINPILFGIYPLEIFLLTLIALTLGILGANAITCYIDRDIDAKMNRTKKRPLPSLKIKPQKALAYGIFLSFIGLIILLAINIYSALWAAFGLLDSALVYNFFTKRRSPWNIILGSPSGGTPIMSFWTAVSGQAFNYIPFLMSILVVLWTPAHIWSLAIKYSEDYAKANVPMLPTKVDFKVAARCIASTSLMLPIVSTLLGIVGGFTMFYYIIVYVINIIIIFLSLRLVFKPSEKKAWQLFKFTSPYLFILLTITALTIK